MDEGSKQFTFRGHTDAITELKLYSEETALLSCSMDESLIAWDLHKGHRTAVLNGHVGAVTSYVRAVCGVGFRLGRVRGGAERMSMQTC